MTIAKIHNLFKNLTETEQKLASYVLSSPDKVVTMTARELADACGTVPSAVNRMCKSIGLEGFAKLKLSLAADIGKGNPLECESALPDEHGAKKVFAKVFSSGITALQNTYQMLDFSQMQTIAQKISSSQRVFIFGIGTSAVIAVDAAYRFSQLGVHAYAYTDIVQMNVMAKNMQSGDIAFCISHSGTTKPVVDAMRTARERGATAVALTSFSKSILYTESDYGVCVYADEENYPVEAVSARIAHMCIVDALMMTIASLNYDEYSRHISARNEVLDDIRY